MTTFFSYLLTTINHLLLFQLLSPVWIFVTSELQHTRHHCPLSSGVCTNSYPLSQWCHPTTSSSIAPFSWPQYFPAAGGHSIGASVPMNIQSWFPLWLASLIYLQSMGLSRVFSKIPTLKASILQHSAFFPVQILYLYMINGKIIALTIQIIVSKVMSLLFNTLSRFVTSFFPRNKCFCLFVCLFVCLFLIS